MSGAVSAVADVVTAPLKAFGLLPKAPEPLVTQQGETRTGLSETEKTTLAQQEASRKKNKAKSGTKTVLTSPLGATTTASTAVSKLGGA